jgi:2-dehydro-3-deoxyphosphogluconate aldolase / (4S)-4-hydroxy-2-oxoglutarate aldolase
VSILDRLAAQRVVPVLRCADAADAVSTARAAARAGLHVVELTHSTPGVLDALQELGRDQDVLPGLGTITSAEEIGPAVAAGALFVVSFRHPRGFVTTAHEVGVPAIPAAFSPEEVGRCADAGADIVKLFPAARLGPDFVRDMRAVLPNVRYLATGGIQPDAESVRPWLEAGAIAVGIGSAIGTVATVGVDRVECRCRAARAAASP